MKKIIALTLMVVCLGMFSLGCQKTEPAKPAEPAPVEETTPAADAEKPADAAPASEAKTE